MKIMFLAASAATIAVCLTGTPVAAQQAIAPSMQLPAVNPSMSLSAPTNSPVAEQTRQNYATGLMGAQRDLLQKNPSGLGRQEQAIGRELNGYTAPR